MLVLDALDPDINMQAKTRAISPNRMYLCGNIEITRLMDTHHL
jgi:hypothetical protein